jgi:hypothetical protein
MKKLLFTTAIALLFISCSNDESTTEPTQEPTQNYELTFLDARYQKLNIYGEELPISIGDPVTIFEPTTHITITAATFETNDIAPVVYFKTNNTYSLPGQIQFQFSEYSRNVIKIIEYPTRYGKDKRTERYSY